MFGDVFLTRGGAIKKTCLDEAVPAGSVYGKEALRVIDLGKRSVAALKPAVTRPLSVIIYTAVRAIGSLFIKSV